MDTISKQFMLVMGGVMAKMYMNDMHSYNIRVDSFRIIAVHGDSVRSAVNPGAHYSEEAKALINSLEKGDHVIISQIVVTNEKRTGFKARPAEFVIGPDKP